MFYVSDIYREGPKEFLNFVQERTYQILDELGIEYERVETAEAITMGDCVDINRKLNMKMVKTLFLCNRQETEFYLYVTLGDKKFDSKKFSQALNISRVSFAKEERMKQMLGTKIGAATIFSTLVDEKLQVSVVIDQDVLREEYYGCSDGTTTGYMKIKTDDVISKVLPYSRHEVIFIEM